LIKPQFEAGRQKVGKGGVVRDPAVHRAVIVEVLSAAGEHEWKAVSVAPSPVLGPSGNREFLAYLVKGQDDDVDVEGLADSAVR
jgi:23S rRNA (cytidine1920-2'-O)/16S rRNA (cytidine1409-2'-O)-methyltransferase